MALALGLHAAGHQRGLGGVEAGDGAAGHGDEHEAPDGGAGGVHVIEVVPQLRHLIALGEDSDGYAEGHDNQADAEDRIHLADDLVHGHKGGDEVVNQNQHQPEHLVGQDAAGVLAQELEQARRAHGEHGAHHDQQHHAEHTHDVFHAAAQVNARDLGDGRAVIPLGQHAREVVVNAAGENGAEGNPQKHAGPPQRTGQRAENGTQARDVQQLDQKQLPLGHDDVVDSVVDADGGSLPVVRPKGVVDHFAVDKVAANQQGQTDEETNHMFSSLFDRSFLPLSDNCQRH